jgi:hypothetical protein
MLKRQSSQSRPHFPRRSPNGMVSSRMESDVSRSAFAALVVQLGRLVKVRKSAPQGAGKTEPAYAPYMGSFVTESCRNHDDVGGLAAARCGCREWEKTRTRPAAFTPALTRSPASPPSPDAAR